MSQSTRSSKRLSKKPRRYKTTSSEEEVRAKKTKRINEEKAKEKVSYVMQNIRTTFKNVSNNTEENTVCNLPQNMHQKTVKNFYSFNANNTNNTPSQDESNVTQPVIQLHNVQNLENDGRQLLNLPHCQQSFQNIAFNNTNNTPCQKFSINKNSSPCVTRHESNITTGNITQPTIQLYDVQHLENDERQLLNNSSRRQQSFQNIACNNPSEKLNHTQTLGNIVPVEPRQEENNASLLRRENDVQIEILRDLQQKIQKVNKRLDSMEQKIDGNIVNAMPMKPQMLPFSNIDAIRMFTKEDSALYNEVVNYFKFLNCMTLKDSVHQCVKEAITIQLAQQLTWWGVTDFKFAFYNTVLCQAIYQAVGSNRYYPKSTREEFQREVVASLKVAKQRLRNATERHPGIQGRRQKLQAAADALYNDENISNHEDDGNQSESENSNNIRDTENESDDSGEYS